MAGFFDGFGIGQALDIALGVGGLFQQSKVNQQNQANFGRNLAFQREVAQKGHQWEVADLRAAGLNPILSATGGAGAKASGGSSLPNIGNKITTALQAKLLSAQSTLAQAQARNTNAEAQNRENLQSSTGNISKIADQANRVIDAMGDAIKPENLKFLKDQLKIDGQKAVDALIRYHSRVKGGAKALKQDIQRLIHRYLGNTKQSKDPLSVEINYDPDEVFTPDYIPPKFRTKRNWRR